MIEDEYERLRGGSPSEREHQLKRVNQTGFHCDIRAVLAGNVACLGDCKEDTYVVFLHPAFIIFNVPSLPEPHTLDFAPGKFVYCSDCVNFEIVS